MKREKDTEYILSLSYGKDSLACLEAIKQLGLPLDRIVHAEVWATDDISADLPPMVEFKKCADKIIKERYGIEVEHVCATVPRENSSEPEDDRKLTYEKTVLQKCDTVKTNSFAYMDSLIASGHGVIQGSKSEFSVKRKTYESEFYRIPKRKVTNKRFSESDIRGFPVARNPWCNSCLKMTAL